MSEAPVQPKTERVHVVAGASPSDVRDPEIRREFKRASVWFGIAVAIATAAMVLCGIWMDIDRDDYGKACGLLAIVLTFTPLRVVFPKWPVALTLNRHRRPSHRTCRSSTRTRNLCPALCQSR